MKTGEPPPEPERPRKLSPALVYFGRVAFGFMWRAGLLIAAMSAVSIGFGPPWYAVAALIMGGLALGLWHRRSRLAGIWRFLVLGLGIAYFAPSNIILIEGSFSAAAVAPWFAARRRRKA